MNEIKKLSELDERQISQSVSVFVESFYDVMSSISKDKEKLYNLFKNSFDYDMTYAYLQDGEAVGFLGLGSYQKRSLKLDKEIFMEIMGGFAGKMSYRAVSAAMEKPNISSPQEIFIDFLATNPEYRSQGIGSKLIEFVRDTLGYKYIELEVFSKNPRAIKLYQRVGFKVIKEKKDFMMMMRGFGKRIIMRLEAE